MTDDELLASAFRKILNPPTYHYVWLSDETETPRVTLDATWTDDDGLTDDEMDAMRRVFD